MSETFSEGGAETVDDNTMVFRVVLKGDYIDEYGVVQSGAFMPRPDGQDDTGLSVERVNLNSYPDVETGARIAQGRFNIRKGGVAILSTGKVRNLSDQVNRKIDIIPASVPANPEHALITGLPPIINASEKDLDDIEWIAGKLARISKLVIRK